MTAVVDTPFGFTSADREADEDDTDAELSLVIVDEKAEDAFGQLAPSLATLNVLPSEFLGAVPILVTKGFGSSRSSPKIRYTLPPLAWK